MKTHPLHNPVWAIELCDFLQAHQINPALAEAHFRVLPEEIPQYSHYRPADWLIRNSTVLDGDTTEVTETLEKAEKVIAVYNAMLS